MTGSSSEGVGGAEKVEESPLQKELDAKNREIIDLKACVLLRDNFYASLLVSETYTGRF